jgi:hypothetical protein
MEIIKAYQVQKRKELWCKALAKSTFEEVLTCATEEFICVA